MDKKNASELTECSAAEYPHWSAAFPAFASIVEWCRMSGMGRSSTYEALGAGHLRARKLGSKTLVDVPHGFRWLNSLPVATVRPHGAKRPRPAA